MREFQNQFKLYKGTGAQKQCTCGMHIQCCCGGLHEKDKQRLHAVRSSNDDSSRRRDDVGHVRTDENVAPHRNDEND